jgi:hypothetical protein
MKSPIETRIAYWCGWACLFALITFATNLLDSEQLDPSHHRFILILGLLGIWRYSNASIHFLRGVYFLHWRFPHIRKKINKLGDDAYPDHVFMVITSFRIPSSTTYQVYRALFQEMRRMPVSSTIIASIVEKGDENFIKQIMRETIYNRPDIKLILVRARGTGKRDGLAHAFRALSRQMPSDNTITGVVDGDTIMMPHCIERAIKVFSIMPTVGGLTTNEYCAVDGGRIMRDWHAMRFVQRQINMCSMALSKRVLTMTGRLSFFRTSALIDPLFIRDVEADFLQHWRLGRFRFLTGDDKSSWFSLMRAGWETFYVPDSHIVTVEHPPDKNFFRASRKLMFRWSGNSLRQNFRATHLLGLHRLGFFAMYVLYDQRVAMWTCLVGITSSLIASILFGMQFLAIYAFWILLSRTLVTILYSFTNHKVTYCFPFVLYYNQIMGSLMKVYTMFHLDQQMWTRQKTKIIGEQAKIDLHINTLSSKITMISALCIFMAIIILILPNRP